MVLLRSSPERLALVAVSKRAFKSTGWSIASGEDVLGVDFIIAQADLSFFVQCIDVGIKTVVSEETLIEQMSNDVIEFKRRKGIRLIHVLNFSFLKCTLVELIPLGVVAFHFSELGKIYELCHIKNSLATLDPRCLSLIKSQRIICLKISRSYLDQKQIEAAIEWAECAINADKKQAGSYVFLLKILIDYGYASQAEEISKTALILGPQNIGILSLCKKLAEQRGDLVLVEKLSNKLKSIPEQADFKFRQSFANADARPKNKEVTHAISSSHIPTNEVKTMGWFGRIARRRKST